MTIVTRFAPSPTGYLHIGAARTALFNYLIAKHYGGKFLLRIEDTDAKRSTEEARLAIINSLQWLEIDWDGDIIYQSKMVERHKEIAHKLLELGKAYYCYTSQEEVNLLREQSIKNGEHFIFQSPWRDSVTQTPPSGIKPVIRIKAPRTGQTIVEDLLQGDVVFENNHLDDMIILKSDGTPTYMLAVVVDDHDMGITHIIRGDDHLTNSPRQQLIYNAMGWEIPKMVHIPLIHGQDGAKLSKRHGAMGVEGYKDMGYLPEAICNYLLRLGFGHGDHEIISRQEAISWFSIDGLGKSPSRLDFNKLNSLNSHYLRNKDSEDLLEMIISHFEHIEQKSISNILAAMPEIKPRISSLTDLYELAKIFIVDEVLWRSYISDTDPSIINNSREQKNLFLSIENAINNIDIFNKDVIKQKMSEFALEHNTKLSDIMMSIRLMITRKTSSPSVFAIMEILGKGEVVKRIKEFISLLH